MIRIFQNEDTVIKGFIHKSRLSFTSWGRKNKKILLPDVHRGMNVSL